MWVVHTFQWRARVGVVVVVVVVVVGYEMNA
jgi:hypothetical protein